MSKSRTPLILGGGLAAGIGYYFYAAGRTPQAGRSPNAEGELKQAGAKIDGFVSEADRQAGVVKSNVEAVARDAKAEALKVVDKFDHRIEEEAAKAKGGVSSWFGGGSK
ncbi:hypothetical protein F66182_1583 [Fusarium sp. NRRL 66182]|nr:hypothetical protein F66182_1583 [Fusarium sp. NRRL 66182]